MQELEDLALKVQNSLITRQDGIRQIVRIIYTNRPLFSLQKLSEDQLHDFIVYEMKALNRIFSVYDRNMGSFTSFLIGNIKCNLMTWQKAQKNQEYSRACSVPESINEYEEKRYRYGIDEYSLECRSYIDEENNRQLNKICRSAEERLNELNMSKTRSHRYDPAVRLEKQIQLRKEAILILALKACYYLDDDMIAKVSIMTSVPFNDILVMRQKLLQEMESKINKRARCIRIRDTAYFYKNRFMQEIRSCQRNDYWTEAVTGKYEKHKARWEKHNALIQDGAVNISPTNKSIAMVTGINERHVYYVLKQMEKKMDTILVKEYIIDHENLLGNRKPEQEKGNG